MKSRRKPIKRILFASLALALGIAYLHFGIFPGNLKKIAVDEIESLTHRKVVFEKTVYLPFRGLSFYNLKIMDRSGRLLFSAKRLSLNARFMEFIRTNKIVINRVELDQPVFDYAPAPPAPAAPPPPPVMTKISGQIAVPVVPKQKKISLSTIEEEGLEAFMPENVYLEELEIMDGIVTFHDRVGAAVETLRDINLRIRFDKPPVLKIDGTVRLGDKTYGFVSLKGAWDLDRAEYEFFLESKSAKVPRWLLDYQKKNFLIVEDGEFAMKTHVRSVNEQKIVFHTEADLNHTLMSIKNARYAGRMSLDVAGAFDFRTKSFPAYKGSLDFVDVNVTGLSPQLPSLNDISGHILFEPNLLDITAVRGQQKDTVFEAHGKLKSFKDLNVEAEIHSLSSVEGVLALIPEAERKLLKDFDVSGHCEAVTEIEGSLKKPNALKSRHKLVIRDGAVKNAAKRIDVSALSAEVYMNDEGVKLTRTKFLYAGKPVELTANFPKEPSKTGEIHINTPDAVFSASYTRDGDTTLIKEARLTAAGLFTKFQGICRDPANPRLDIHGTSEIDLQKITPLVSRSSPAVKDLGLRGEIKGRFTFKGPVQNWMASDFKMDALSPVIFIKEKIRLDRFEVQVRFRNGALNIPYFHAHPYHGTAGLRFYSDLSKPDPLFASRLYANNLDLAAMAPDLGITDKPLTGTAIFDLTLKGFLKKPETFLGEGSIDIRQGHLWQTDIFKQMGTLPFVRVEGLDDVVFHDLTAAFRIRGKRVWTDDLALRSDTVNLSLTGSIGFDQTLDLVMNIGYSSGVMQGALDTGGIVPFVIEKASGMISQYRITGTLKNPKNEKILMPAGQTVARKLTGLVQTVV